MTRTREWMRHPIKWLVQYRNRTSDYQITRAYVLAWCIDILHHVIVILAGFAGIFVATPPTVEIVLGGQIAIYLWSSLFVVFGFMALIARLFNRLRAEVVAILSIAGARTLWAGLIVFAISQGKAPVGSLQIALLMLSGAAFLLGWSLTLLVWLTGSPLTMGPKSLDEAALVEQLRTHLQDVVEHHAAEDGEK